MRRTLYVVTYKWGQAASGQIRETYPRHRVHIDQLGQEGGLWLIGTLADATTASAADDAGDRASLGDSAMAVFSDLSVAQEFVTNDPYVREDLIGVGPIQAWTPIEYTSSDDRSENDKER